MRGEKGGKVSDFYTVEASMTAKPSVPSRMTSWDDITEIASVSPFHVCYHNILSQPAFNGRTSRLAWTTVVGAAAASVTR